MRLAKTWPALPAVGVALAVGRILYAAHRPDLPNYDNNETSGAFGDPGLPGLRIVALGDSSVTAPGVHHLDDAWIRRVAHSLTDRYFVHLRSVAVGGAKTHEVRSHQLEEALAYEPDIAFISIGGNDAIRAIPTSQFREDLDAITASLTAAGSSVVIVGIGDLGALPRLPRFLRAYLTRRSRRFDRVSAEVAARYAQVVKVDTREFSELLWTELMMFSGDMFHPSSYGHQYFARFIGAATERLLGSTPPRPRRNEPADDAGDGQPMPPSGPAALPSPRRFASEGGNGNA